MTVGLLLDRAAAANVPDLAGELRTADLQRDGWTVTGPSASGDGGEQVRLSKSFADPAGAARVLAELTGPAAGGAQPLAGFRITQRRRFLSTTTTFHGVVDLTCGLSCFSDARLTQVAGEALDAGRLRQLTGADPTGAVSFDFQVRLPGTLRSTDAPTRAGAGAGAEWQASLGSRLTLDATSEVRDTRRLALLWLAGLAAVASVLTLAASLLLRRRRRSRGGATVDA